MAAVWIVTFGVTLLLMTSWVQGAVLPYLDVTLDWDKRLDDLIGRLTLDEIQEQMARGGAGTNGGPAPAIPRLNISPYSWNTECLHGDARSGAATSFPQSIGLAATFSTDLIHRMTDVIGTEVRAKFNDYMKNHQYGNFRGASCFSPVINIMRHPRWGRNQETYGEDPYLSGMMSVAFDLGLKGNHSRFVRTTGSCKHFAAHDGPENLPVSRFSFDARVSERDLRTTYLPAFRRCITGGAYSIMCSYNRLNGVPACANQHLLTDILRKEWGFRGYVVSDQAAIENIIDRHHYFTDRVDTVAACVNAGCNLELSNNEKTPVFSYLGEAIRRGLVNESVARAMVRPLFYTRMRLGEFDPPSSNPYAQLDLTSVLTDAHKQLSLEAAMKTFVLLKNDNSFLPLSGQVNKIAVVGPMADNMEQTYGSYKVTYSSLASIQVSPVQGLQKMARHFSFAAGCDDNKCAHYNSHDVTQAVHGADLTIVCLGLGQQMEDEFKDRPDMQLPGSQKQLLLDAISAAHDKPVVLLLFNGGPVDVGFAQNDSNVKAILEIWYPGQTAGEAIRRVLLNEGDNSAPAGRLPYTWYRDESQVPSMTDYSMQDRTYRYFKGTPLYPFGYGLSYTTFQYSAMTCDSTIKAGDSIHCRLTVANTGKVASDEVVQVYLEWGGATVPTPQRQLVYFKRVHVKASASLDLDFAVAPDQMGVWVDGQGWMVEPGKLTLYGGGQQPHQAVSVPSNVVSATVTVSGYKELGVF